MTMEWSNNATFFFSCCCGAYILLTFVKNSHWKKSKIKYLFIHLDCSAAFALLYFLHTYIFIFFTLSLLWPPSPQCCRWRAVLQYTECGHSPQCYLLCCEWTKINPLTIYSSPQTPCPYSIHIHKSHPRIDKSKSNHNMSEAQLRVQLERLGAKSIQPHIFLHISSLCFRSLIDRWADRVHPASTSDRTLLI